MLRRYTGEKAKDKLQHYIETLPRSLPPLPDRLPLSG